MFLAITLANQIDFYHFQKL